MFLRIFNLFWSSVLILSSAAGCTLPGTNTNTAAPVVTNYGVIKVIDQGNKKQIGAVNFLEQKDFESGETNTDRGLSKVTNGSIFLGKNKNEYYLVSQKQGIYHTENAGELWRRIYVFSLESFKDTPEERAVERDNQVAKNNQFNISGFIIDPNDPNIMYVSGLYGTIGKIYKSSNKGKTFEEKYSEVNPEVAVTRVTVNPNNSFEIYAVLGANTIIRSTDGGSTWQKTFTFTEGGAVSQFGFIPELNNIFWVFQAQGGLSTSIDSGNTWTKIKMVRQSAASTENPNKDTFDTQSTDTFSSGAKSESSVGFGNFERFIPIKSKIGDFMMLADKQLWVTNGLDQPWKKVNLPLQGDQSTITAVEPDPKDGIDKIYLTIGNKLFLSQNRGESWSSETLPITVPVVKIVIDPNDTGVLYMSLGANQQN